MQCVERKAVASINASGLLDFLASHCFGDGVEITEEHEDLCPSAVRSQHWQYNERSGPGEICVICGIGDASGMSEAHGYTFADHRAILRPSMHKAHSLPGSCERALWNQLYGARRP